MISERSAYLGLGIAIGLALWALWSVLDGASSQTLPVPVQPLHHEAQEPVEKVRPKASPRPPAPRQTAQERPVPCWEVPNGAARTIACANGYWITTMPDGTVVTGMGVQDPNAVAAGSTILIDPRTGGPVANGPNVRAPDGTIATPGPGQWWYGHPAPQ
jgi:hypothetical protein